MKTNTSGMFSQATTRMEDQTSDFMPWDNPENIISRQTEVRVRAVVVCLMVPLFVVGVPGNIISAVVFHKLGLRQRINVCLLVLALIDLVVVVSEVLVNGETLLRDWFHLHSWFFSTYFVGFNGFVWASQFLSAVIASERCFCVVSPFHAKRLLKTSTMAAIIVVTSAVLVAGMFTIVGLKHRIVSIFDPATNVTEYIVYVTEYYENNRHIIDAIDSLLYGTILPAMFLAVLFVTSIITGAGLRSALAHRFSMTTSAPASIVGCRQRARLSRREIAVTRMLLGSNVLVLVCTTPALIVYVTSFILPDLSFSGRYYNLNSLMWSLIALFRDLSSSVNFFIYVTIGSRFRHTLRTLTRLTATHGQSSGPRANALELGVLAKS